MRRARPAWWGEWRADLRCVLQRTAARNVAARAGVAPSTVSRWLAGSTLPSSRARDALARGYPGFRWGERRA